MEQVTFHFILNEGEFVKERQISKLTRQVWVKVRGQVHYLRWHPHSSSYSLLANCLSTPPKKKISSYPDQQSFCISQFFCIYLWKYASKTLIKYVNQRDYDPTARIFPAPSSDFFKEPTFEYSVEDLLFIHTIVTMNPNLPYTEGRTLLDFLKTDGYLNHPCPLLALNCYMKNILLCSKMSSAVGRRMCHIRKILLNSD